jgi:hypothetical protein
MSGLRDALKATVSRIGRDDVPVDVQAAEYIATFRQWLEDEGLVVVPREATQEMTGAVLEPGELRWKVMKMYAAMIAAAPTQPGEK